MKEEDFVDISHWDDTVSRGEDEKTNPTHSTEHNSRDAMSEEQLSGFTHVSSNNGFTRPPHDLAAFSNAMSSKGGMSDFERQFENLSKSAPTNVTSQAGSALLDRTRDTSMVAGQKRTSPSSFYEMYHQDQRHATSHENHAYAPNAFANKMFVESAVRNSFKMPTALKEPRDFESRESDPYPSPEPTPRKKRRCKDGSSMSLNRDLGANMVQSESPLGRSTTSTGTIGFSSPEPTKPYDTIDLTEVSNAAKHSSKERRDSGSRKRDRYPREFAENNTTQLRKQNRPASLQLPQLPPQIQNSATDLNNLIATLTDVPNIMQGLHDQYSGLIHSMATRINVQEEMIYELKNTMNLNLKDIADQTEARIMDVYRELNEKMQEVIHSNEEVVLLQNPRAGGAYGGPRITGPSKATSVFHGLLKPGR